MMNTVSVPSRPVPPRGLAAVSGAIAALAALAVGELVAAFLTAAPSPVASVGSALIDLAPPGSKEVVVGLFGTNDKPALLLLVAAVVLLAGAGIGLLGRRSVGLAAIGISALVAVGALASLRDPSALLVMVVLSAALQAGVGLQALVMLLGWATPRAVSVAGDITADADAVAVPGRASDVPTANATRRSFLVKAGALAAVAAVGGLVGRSIVEGRAQGAATAAVAIPAKVVSPAPSIAPDDAFAIDGITPLVIANEDFYRIDTALVTPTVNIATWKLRVHGMVDKEVELTFDELVQMPLVERYVTIACVSNEVGGDLIGNAKWTGVLLSDVLDLAGVQAGATQVVPRSVDGWAAGFPTAWITDSAHPRDALVAVKMNDEPLPAAHGFPARLIVPGLYGYVSATKWLSEIELTTLEAFDSYWVPRGWSKEAPILTQSRIDVPRRESSVVAGPVAVAGVAWAPDRGVSKVEVRVDDGAWQEATMATAIGPQTWVQWKLAWQATAGEHVLSVRATDGTGETQTEKATPPPPDGARGYHQIRVKVS